jgi:hypothetical protein
MQKIQYKGGVNAADTSASPSKAIWGDCPVLDMTLDPSVGIHYYDDFMEFPILATPTITTEAGLGYRGLKAFGSSGGTLTMPTADDQAGGIVLTESDDNEGISIAQIQLPFNIINTGPKFWFEARIKTNTIANTKHGFFLGLMGSQTLSATVPIAAAGTLADNNFVGFHRLEGDGDYVDTVYKADGVTQVTVDTDAQVLVADTFIKLGMVFEPRTQLLTFYADGVPLAETLAADVLGATAGTDFPNDAQMGLCYALLCASNDDAVGTMSWWRAAQLKA